VKTERRAAGRSQCYITVSSKNHVMHTEAVQTRHLTAPIFFMQHLTHHSNLYIFSSCHLSTELRRLENWSRCFISIFFF